MKKLLISVDLDEFFHVRWISGSNNSLYSNREKYYEEVNGFNQCGKKLDEQTRIILDLFSVKDIQSTFFIPGEVAENYPELVKLISGFGHEIACHSYRHIDLSLHSKESFKNELIKAKDLLENLVGKEVYSNIFRDEIRIENTHLLKGVYIVEVITNSMSRSKRLIIK